LTQFTSLAFAKRDQVAGEQGNSSLPMRFLFSAMRSRRSCSKAVSGLGAIRDMTVVCLGAVSSLAGSVDARRSNRLYRQAVGYNQTIKAAPRYHTLTTAGATGVQHVGSANVPAPFEAVRI
jgi:hypothetical protein